MMPDGGTTAPGLDGRQPGTDRTSTGVQRTVQNNSVQRTGRPDGTVATELVDPDGFDPADTDVANGWGGSKGPNGDPSVQRTGRQEVSGLTTLGYPSNERGFTPPTTNVTSSGGGKISPA